MKILILPSQYITNYKQRTFDITKAYIKNLLKKKINIKDTKSHFILNEHYHYSNLPIVNGKENTFIVGEYFKEYKSKTIPNDTRYPSLHNSPEATHISFNDAINQINIFDVVIVGIKSGKYGKKILEVASKKDIFCCIVDYSDDFEVYKKENYKNYNLICKGLEYKKDFQLYFKHDIPIDLNIDYLEPLSPMPINFENYPLLKEKSFKDKIYNYSFVGRIHNNVHNARSSILSLLNKIEGKKFIKEYNSNSIERLSLKNYCEILNESKICLTPWGKVWDSARHPEPAIYGNVPLIPKPNCKLANDISLNDNNSILYETLKSDEKFIIIKENEVLEKINHCISNENYFKKLKDSWRHEMLCKNTLLERAKYILKKINYHKNSFN